MAMKRRSSPSMKIGSFAEGWYAAKDDLAEWLLSEGPTVLAQRQGAPSPKDAVAIIAALHDALIERALPPKGA